MSKLYYRYKFQYDDNCGNLQDAVVYQEINNTTDTETFYDNKGNIIQANGTTDYIIKLGAILCGISFDGVEITFISYKEFNSIFNSEN